jgi:5-methylcytosine-specific restriction endonuclease McrA
MPSRAPRVCGLCGGVHPSGERCPKAAARARERKARFDRTRPNSSRRGYDREWEEAARSFLAANRQCECGAPATVVRHVISIRKRPDLRMDRTNWRPGCQRCNALDAARERRNPKGVRP